MKIILLFLVAVTSLVSVTFLNEGFSELENTYVSEKCGVSIQYPKDWTVTESDFATDNSKTIANLQSQDDDIYSLDILLEKYGLADMSIEEVSKSEQEYVLSYPDANILESSTMEINGFPASKISYVEGLVGEYEFEQEKFHTMEYVIIAHDREYRIKYQAADQNEFDKYSSIVEEMANTLKISKPDFEGVKC